MVRDIDEKEKRERLYYLWVYAVSYLSLLYFTFIPRICCILITRYSSFVDRLSHRGKVKASILTVIALTVVGWGFCLRPVSIY